MKKFMTSFMALLLSVSLLSFAGCASQTENPGTPPDEVIRQDNSGNASGSGDTSGDSQSGNSTSSYEGDIIENAVSVQIGKKGKKDWIVNMYNNAAALTMLDYLSGSKMLFPTYTYEEEQGFVAQDVRGNYTRDDETTITDIKAGELYLFSGGQLRLYFKDMSGANITATPVGYYTDTEGLTEAVQDAYESNKGDTWGVDVYFQIKKLI
ncbi:MAG: hypothetical protein J1E62_03570 [Lachnospiraceae bacterium]|nr:hypothetical protein [Lachnospiraceae bacterium]